LVFKKARNQKDSPHRRYIYINGKPELDKPSYNYVMIDGEWKEYTERRENNPKQFSSWDDAIFLGGADKPKCKYLSAPMN